REASTASGGIHTAAVDGVTTLHVDSRSSDVHVAFGDVAEAQLSVSPADSNAWHWTTAGNTLIATNQRPFYNICFGWCGNRNEEVTITLPEELDGNSPVASRSGPAGSAPRATSRTSTSTSPRECSPTPVRWRKSPPN